jgi:hypothetical protein
VKPSFLLIFVLSLCPGCRSDGGFGRQDAVRGMEFSTDRVASRFHDDCRRTSYLFSSIPSAFSNSVAEGWQNMRNTYHLYLENHETR